MTTSRICLAIAHQSMTTDEIAAHALLLAALLDQQIALIDAQNTLVGTLAERLGSVQSVLTQLDGAVRAIQSRVENGQARRARQLLAELAAIPPLPDMPPVAVALPAHTLPAWVANPVGSRPRRVEV